MAVLYGRAIIDTLHERVGEEEDVRGRQGEDDDETLNGVWGRVMAWTGEREGDARGIYGSRGPQFDYRFYALQAGMDVYRRETDEGVRDHAGVYGAIGRVDGDVRHYNGRDAGWNTLDAYSLGAYWTRFGEKAAYLDGVVQFTWYDGEVRSTRLPKLEVDAKGFTASLEGGKPLHVKPGWVVEPQAQLIYQHFFEVETRDVGGRVRFDDDDSLLGRLGVRVARTWERERDDGETVSTTGWVRLNYWHEFMDPPTVTFFTDDGPLSFTSDPGEDWMELNLGVSGRYGPKTTIYWNGSYQWDLDGRGHAWMGKLGFRWNW